jgi:hypothetical protein
MLDQNIGFRYSFDHIITNKLLNETFIRKWITTIAYVFPITCKQSDIVDGANDNELQYYAILYKQCGKTQEYLMYYDIISG